MPQRSCRKESASALPTETSSTSRSTTPVEGYTVRSTRAAAPELRHEGGEKRLHLAANAPEHHLDRLLCVHGGEQGPARPRTSARERAR